MTKLIYILILVILIKVTFNLVKYLQCKNYLQKYIRWLANQEPNLKEDQHQVIKLFEDAGIKDHVFGFVDPVGYGYGMTGQATVFDNFPSNREDIVKITYGMFQRAIGVYHSRMLEPFNPIFWIEFIIYLPRNVFTYLGVSAESIIIRIFQLIYWIVSLVLTILYAIFTPEIEEIARNLIQSFFS